jgi:hypothetical protein
MHRKMSINSSICLVTVLLAITCIFSSAVPAKKANRTQLYARLEEVLNPAQGDPNSDNYYQTVNLTIHFYSDAGASTPAAPTSNVNYDISYTGYLETPDGTQNFSDVYGQGVASSGNTTAEYDAVATWEGHLINGGVVEEKFRQDYELSSIEGGIIILPAITQSHTPGY